MAKRGTLEHPKTLTLADELGIMDCFALGILEAFWQYVSKYHEDGDVSSLRPGSMARSIRYTGDAEKLWQSMILAGFLDVLDDGRIIVHDWSEHCEDSVHTKLYRAVRRFADGTKPKSRSVGTKEKEQLDSLWTSENRPADVPPKPMPKPMPIDFPTCSPSQGKDPEEWLTDHVEQAVSEAGTNSKLFHDFWENLATFCGFEVEREFPVPDRGDGVPGKIDLVVRGESWSAAFEFDSLSPREKSLRKLAALHEAQGIPGFVVCRNGQIVDVQAEPPLPAKAPRRTWADVCREMCKALPQHSKNLEIWFKYRPRKPGGVWIEDTVAQNIELWRDWPVERLGAAIEHSIRNSYQGIYEPKTRDRAVVKTQTWEEEMTTKGAEIDKLLGRAS